MKLWKLTQSLETKEDFTNAQFAQGAASLGEAALLKSGVSSIQRLFFHLSQFNIS
jgi:4-hydroxy-2-oxoglutarate aldolase